MAQITPEKHMVLLNRAWHNGIDKETTKNFIYKHMHEFRKIAIDNKSEEYVKGFTKAMNIVTLLLECTSTFEEIAKKEVPNA